MRCLQGPDVTRLTKRLRRHLNNRGQPVPMKHEKRLQVFYLIGTLQ